MSNLAPCLFASSWVWDWERNKLHLNRDIMSPRCCLLKIVNDVWMNLSAIAKEKLYSCGAFLL